MNAAVPGDPLPGALDGFARGRRGIGMSRRLLSNPCPLAKPSEVSASGNAWTLPDKSMSDLRRASAATSTGVDVPERIPQVR